MSEPRPSRARISSRTTGVAVAVQASTRGGPQLLQQRADLQVLGRKSWPHSLMQWASSIATSGGASSRASARKPGYASRSGAT